MNEYKSESEHNKNFAGLTKDEMERIESFRNKHATELLVIIFTDLEGSTEIQEKQGDQVSENLDEKHCELLMAALDKILKRSLDEIPKSLYVRARKDELMPQAVRTEGDSYIFVFLKPSDAVEFALRAQLLHREEREKKPDPSVKVPLPQFRVGIHLGTVIVKDRYVGEKIDGKIADIKGHWASMTARIMSLAEGGQILCSRAVFDDARQSLKGIDIEGLGELEWKSHGFYLLKGRDEPFEICEVGEEKFARYKTPAGNKKARPVNVSDNSTAEDSAQTSAEQTKCLVCGNDTKPDWEVCPVCEEPLRLTCPKCGNDVEKNWKMCPKCKKELTQPSNSNTVSSQAIVAKGGSTIERVKQTKKGDKSSQEITAEAQSSIRDADQIQE